MTKALELSYSDVVILQHIQRLHAAIFNTYNLQDVVRYLEEKTFLNGDRFSFLNHEFQKDILSDISLEVNVQKCAQVGMSEAMARYALAICRIMPYFSVILTMPSSKDAGKFAKTRIDPIIADSADLRDHMDPDLDNSEMKGIENSLLYLRGTRGSTAALSVPADMLIHDEIDRSDPDTIGQYQSRLKHSPWKLTRRFGTPTLDGVGIALAMASSKRKRHMCKCHHCNHSFVPNYHSDVVIPGFDRSKQEVTKYNLGNLDWGNAYLKCPRCGEEPSLQMEHRSWVIENPNDKYDAVGYYVSPFSVPNIVSIPGLVKESTKYNSWTEFCNQALGETQNDNDKQLMPQDVEQCKYQADLNSSEMHCMGIDVGQICHILVGRLTLAGELIVIHKERVVLGLLQQKKLELAARFHVLVTVIDAYPETNTVMQMQKIDQNLFGGLYHEDKKRPTYQIKMVEQDLKEGKLPINRAEINRNVNFDEIMDLFKRKMIVWRADGTHEDGLFAGHCIDMKRRQRFDQQQEVIYRWEKSREGEDHYMHTLGYLHVACRLAPAASRKLPFSPSITMFSSFRVKQQ